MAKVKVESVERMTKEEAINAINNRFEIMDYREDKQLEDALDMAIEALEKQIPMKVRITTSTKRCGRCKRQLSAIGNIHPERNYCQRCGQAIDWSKKQ